MIHPMTHPNSIVNIKIPNVLGFAEFKVQGAQGFRAGLRLQGLGHWATKTCAFSGNRLQGFGLDL